MRFSRQREVIKEIVVNSMEHPTADLVYQKAKALIPNISLGTVYRNLGQLVESDIIKSHTLNGVVCYDGNITNHHHFICDHCHEISDIVYENQAIIKDLEKISLGIITDFQLDIYGLCNKCRVQN